MTYTGKHRLNDGAGPPHPTAAAPITTSVNQPQEPQVVFEGEALVIPVEAIADAHRAARAFEAPLAIQCQLGAQGYMLVTLEDWLAHTGDCCCGCGAPKT